MTVSGYRLPVAGEWHPANGKVCLTKPTPLVWPEKAEVMMGGVRMGREGGMGGRFLEQVAAGRVDDVRRMLDQDPALVNAAGPHPYWGGRPQPLHVAIENDRTEVIALLLERGADVNGHNGEYDNWSPLMGAISGGQVELRDELIRRGARIGLAEALLMGDDDRVGTLLSTGVLPAPVPNAGSWVAFARTNSAINALVALGARIDQPDHWGRRPAQALSQLGAAGEPLVRHLATLGAVVTPADFARMGNLAALEAQAQSNPDAVREDAVLLAAVAARDVGMARWLLDRGASANARATGGSRHTALHEAAWKGDIAMAQLLLSAGADARARDEEHHATPAGWAMTALEVTRNQECAVVARMLEAAEHAP